MKVYLLDGSEYQTGFDAEWLYATWDAARKNQLTAFLHLGRKKVNILDLDANRSFSEIIIGNFPSLTPPKPS